MGLSFDFFSRSFSASLLRNYRSAGRKSTPRNLHGKHMFTQEKAQTQQELLDGGAGARGLGRRVSVSIFSSSEGLRGSGQERSCKPPVELMGQGTLIRFLAAGLGTFKCFLSPAVT